MTYSEEAAWGVTSVALERAAYGSARHEAQTGLSTPRPTLPTFFSRHYVDHPSLVS